MILARLLSQALKVIVYIVLRFRPSPQGRRVAGSLLRSGREHHHHPRKGRTGNASIELSPTFGHLVHVSTSAVELGCSM